MKNRQFIFEKVSEVVAEVAECDISEITADINLPNELSVDSLMGLEILVMIEKEFNVKLDEDKLEEMTTVNNITNLVLEEMQKEVVLS